MPVAAAPPESGSMKAIFTSAVAGPARQAIVKPSTKVRRVQAFIVPTGWVAGKPALARIGPSGWMLTGRVAPYKRMSIPGNAAAQHALVNASGKGEYRCSG